MTNPVKVSVLCPTYNHENYIAAAINGVVSQQTSFSFELIIRDDGSNDGTPEVIRHYMKEYPSLIRAVLEPANTYSTIRPRTVLASLAQGEYIAICDGDDYWTEEDKLQRQVDALENSPGMVMSHHDMVVEQDGIRLERGALRKKQRKDFTGYEMQSGEVWAYPSSLMYRNVPIPAHPREAKFRNYDRYLISRLGAFGGSIYLKDFRASVYRLHSESMWHAASPDDRGISAATSYYYIGWQYHNEGNPALASKWLERSREVWQRLTSKSEASKDINAPRQPRFSGLKIGLRKVLWTRIWEE